MRLNCTSFRRRTKEQTALRERTSDLCARLLAACVGPASPLALETLVWLEEQASLEDAPSQAEANGDDTRHAAETAAARGKDAGRPGWRVPQTSKSFAAATAHRFPTCATSWAVLGLMLARRSGGGKGGADKKGGQGKKGVDGLGLAALLLEHGLMHGGGDAGGGSAEAWTALARLRLAASDWHAALAAVAGAMAWVRRRRDGGYGSYASCVLALRVCAAEAHLALGQLDEADSALQKLAGVVNLAGRWAKLGSRR